MKQEEIFRQAALERLSSPEQLDRLLTLTSPRSWLALIALWAMLIVIVIWGIFGSLPTRVQGNGILISQGGRIFDAMSQANGMLLAVTVSVDDLVKKGQVIAKIDQTNLQHKYEHAKIVLQERKQEHVQLKKAFAQEFRIKKNNLKKQRESLIKLILAAQERLKFQQKTLELMENKTGYISRLDVEQLKEKYHATSQQILRSENEILKLEADKIDLKHRHQQELTRSKQRLNEAKRKVSELALELSRSKQVLSPADGSVTEIKAAVGSVIQVGSPIISLESASDNLQLVLYIPPTHGKKIKSGMEVRIAPAPVKKEEFGTLVGEVVEISEFPMTSSGMASVLQNENLVKQFSRQGPPYAARVNLIPDSQAPSKYKWSSGVGPYMTLTSGTLASAEVTIKEQAPISLIIPYFREYTGIGL